jgi:hypothetical protein
MKIVTELFLPRLPKVNEGQGQKTGKGEQTSEQKAVFRDYGQFLVHSGVP